MTRTYADLRRLETFEERYQYLKLAGQVGVATFGFDRHINQLFYRSREWRGVRNEVIIRDQGCDLGIPGMEISTGLLIHHMNPIDVDDIVHGDRRILDPEFLITTRQSTHNAIHYGDEKLLPRSFVPRRAGDTDLWRRK